MAEGFIATLDVSDFIIGVRSKIRNIPVSDKESQEFMSLVLCFSSNIFGYTPKASTVHPAGDGKMGLIKLYKYMHLVIPLRLERGTHTNRSGLLYPTPDYFL
jgi:hypothetical protein